MQAYIPFATFIWLIVGMFVLFGHADSAAPFRQIVGTTLVWPIIAAIYAARAIYEALKAAVQ
jgi:hypothetical protein